MIRLRPMPVTRFAPSITGHAHPGTLLSALLCWLDARSRGGRVILRLEDLDHTRLRAGHAEAMVEALAWLGLEFDEVVSQRSLGAQHEAALDQLAAAGHLYACSCSRARIKASGRPSPDGGVAYANTCRNRGLPGDWRRVDGAVRLRLPDGQIALCDESGLDLSQAPARDMGDPVVVRRDGVVAYHLAVVVDDAASGVDRIIRGRDLAASTATQVLIQRLLGLPQPVYRHHLLLLEGKRGKLAKLHGSIGYPALRERGTAEAWCGRLAALAGLRDDAAPCRPADLLADFDWARVAAEDRRFA